MSSSRYVGVCGGSIWLGILWQDFQSLLEYVGPCLGRQVNLLNPRLRVLRASGALRDSVISRRAPAAIARIATVAFMILDLIYPNFYARFL